MVIDNNVIDVIILAGGKNKRMDGRFKGSLTWHGEAFLDRIVESMRDERGTIRLSYAGPDSVRDVPRGCDVIFDTFKDIGPLGGLISGLKAARTDYVAVCTCDMPFITPALYEFLWEHGTGSGDGSAPLAGVILPETGDGPHPLAALYRRDILPVLEEYAGKGIYKINRILKDLDTLTVTIDSASSLESEVTNINTVDEYRNLTQNVSFPEV